MKIVITGGTGFLGLRLARQLLAHGQATAPSGKREPIEEMVLFDVVVPSSRPEGLDDRVKIVAGEISDAKAIDALIDTPNIGVYHLASVVSGGAEQDFDMALRVNLHGHLLLLEAIRRLGSKPRYLFSSSIAAYGGTAMPKGVSDQTKQTPQTTYGMTKAVGELLVNDYTRKGFIDGRTARLPGVIVRPGKPNKAASGFISAVIREPLNGIDYELPVPLDLEMPVAGYRTVVSDIEALFEADGAKLGDDRAVNLPNLTVTVAQMIESLKTVTAGRTLGAIAVKPDPFVMSIVAGWPTRLDASRAKALGLPKDETLEGIIRAYIEDYLEK
ncbi:MAG: D-erythronate dehydrogenase [Rhodospirillaceae bacterium]